MITPEEQKRLDEIKERRERALEAIDLAMLANCGDTWHGKHCECDPEVNQAPCRYCAIHRGLQLAKLDLLNMDYLLSLVERLRKDGE